MIKKKTMMMMMKKKKNKKKKKKKKKKILDSCTINKQPRRASTSITPPQNNIPPANLNSCNSHEHEKDHVKLQPPRKQTIQRFTCV